MAIGICKMCLQSKELVRSHLIPRKVHEYCHPPGHSPIVLTGGKLMASDRQLQHPLLCFDCEQILNVQGEDWCVDRLATYEKTFPIYDEVKKGKLIDDVDGTLVYAVKDVGGIETDRLLHFGLGMFWKAAVHSWKGGEVESLIDLGPYAEPLRKWLKDGGNFPKHLYLVVHLSPPEHAKISLFTPYLAEKKVWRILRLRSGTSLYAERGEVNGVRAASPLHAEEY